MPYGPLAEYLFEYTQLSILLHAVGDGPEMPLCDEIRDSMDAWWKLMSAEDREVSRAHVVAISQWIESRWKARPQS